MARNRQLWQAAAGTVNDGGFGVGPPKPPHQYTAPGGDPTHPSVWQNEPQGLSAPSASPPRLGPRPGPPANPAAGGNRTSYNPTTDPNNSQFVIPPVAADEDTIAGAKTAYGTASGNLTHGIDEAAFSLGDPGILAQWGQAGVVNPNSALAMAALQAQTASNTNRDVRGNNNSLFSSFALKDQQAIQAAHSRANDQAWHDYNVALDTYNRGMTSAGETLSEAEAPALRDERQTAINNLPTPTVTSGGSPSQGTVGSTPSGGGGGSQVQPGVIQGGNWAPAPGHVTVPPVVRAPSGANIKRAHSNWYG